MDNDEIVRWLPHKKWVEEECERRRVRVQNAQEAYREMERRRHWLAVDIAVYEGIAVVERWQLQDYRIHGVAYDVPRRAHAYQSRHQDNGFWGVNLSGKPLDHIAEKFLGCVWTREEAVGLARLWVLRGEYPERQALAPPNEVRRVMGFLRRLCEDVCSHG